jgi:hypothetical protein
LHAEVGSVSPISDLRIPRPEPAPGVDPAARLGSGCYGKVYILFASPPAASAAQAKFNGRMYDGRTLEVTFIRPTHFYMLPVQGLVR